MNRFPVEFNTFKKVFDSISGEPEFSIIFDEKNTFMIIKYHDYITYQKCGVNCFEKKFYDINELYNLMLAEDWYRIKDILIDEGLSFKDDLDYIIKTYNIN